MPWRVLHEVYILTAYLMSILDSVFMYRKCLYQISVFGQERGGVVCSVHFQYCGAGMVPRIVGHDIIFLFSALFPSHLHCSHPTISTMPKPEFTLQTGIYPAIEPELFNGSLAGKVALVTGSGRGIGREIALALAKSGAAVAVSGRTKSQVDETTQTVLSSASGVKAIAVVGDVCSRTDQDRMVKEVLFPAYTLCFLLTS
jgi:hypothetical protein